MALVLKLRDLSPLPGYILAPYESLSIEDIRMRHLQREAISKLLDSAQVQIKDLHRRANMLGENTFKLHFQFRLNGDVFDDNRVATIVRQWTFLTFRGDLGLERYELKYGRSCIEFRCS